MSLGFLPNRENMYKEIEKWILLRQLDMLKSVCDCCVYKIFDYMLTQECRTCIVHTGILGLRENKDERKLREMQETFD